MFILLSFSFHLLLGDCGIAPFTCLVNCNRYIIYITFFLLPAKFLTITTKIILLFSRILYHIMFLCHFFCFSFVVSVVRFYKCSCFKKLGVGFWVLHIVSIILRKPLTLLKGYCFSHNIQMKLADDFTNNCFLFYYFLYHHPIKWYLS